MDIIVFKVRENGKVINKTVYLCVGLNKERLKEVLGMWIGKPKAASFWMGVLTDLKARGVEDILITVTDNLCGFTDTIKCVFPTSISQICAEILTSLMKHLLYTPETSLKPLPPTFAPELII